MDQENKNIEIKANLYSILKTIPNLNDKYEEGSISEVFFQKSIKNAINSLVNIKILLTQDKIFFSDYIKEINLIEEYNSAISIINKLSSLDFSDDSSERIKSSILELPGITSEITSSFITLMDALKLDSLHDSDLISKLFTELINNIRKFPGLEDIKYKINEISEVALHDVDSLVNNNKLEVIGDELYSLFLVFQNSIR
jgi:hypothetical protein